MTSTESHLRPQKQKKSYLNVVPYDEILTSHTLGTHTNRFRLNRKGGQLVETETESGEGPPTREKKS